MAAKKGKGKGKSGALAKVKAEELRLAQLRALETEAEEFQRSENERRQHDEQEERMSFLRDEQLRIMRDKDRRIDEVMQQLTRVTSAMQEDRNGYESQIHQLSTLRDALLNEESLLKVEMEELHRILQQERGNHSSYVSQLRQTLEMERQQNHDEKQQLRSQVVEVTAVMEDTKRQLSVVCESKESAEHSFQVKERDLERELEKALTMNKALQDALEGREAEDRKNVTLLQLLNAQLDSDKRRFDEDVIGERERANRAQEEIRCLEAKLKECQQQLESIKEQSSKEKRACEDELRELKQLTEQVKFDAEYLHQEMENARAEHVAAVEKLENALAETEAELQEVEVELEAAEKKNSELEALLLRTEREHFDKVTFLNAQIANGRTAIARLQSSMDSERDDHKEELQRHNDAVDRTVKELERVSNAENLQAAERQAYEQRLLSELDGLKSTVKELRTRVVEQDEAFDKLRVAKDAEITRISDILDAHFIPHRQDVEAARASVQTDALCMATEELHALKKEMKLKEAAAHDTEMWLRARLAEQVEVIDALQYDLKQSELGHSETERNLKDEVGRLRKTLEVHFLPTS